MNNRRQTKRALLTSIMALVMCVVMLVGTTFAWFTDTASTNVNKIQAGNLDVELYVGNAADVASVTEWKKLGNNSEPLSFLQKQADGTVEGNANILWEPGGTYNLPALKIVNEGNLALKYKIQINGIGGGDDLNEVIDWTMTMDDSTTALGTEHHLAAKVGDTVDADVLTISGRMQETAGNTYMGKQITNVSIKVVATQDAVEYDSNGNDYDALANGDPDHTVEWNGISLTGTAAVPTAGTSATVTAGRVSVEVPHAAVVSERTEDLMLNIKEIQTNGLPQTEDKIALAYDITLEGVDSETNATEMTVTITDLPKGLNNVCVYWNNDNTLTYMNTTYDAENGTATFKTTHFSKYVLAYGGPVKVTKMDELATREGKWYRGVCPGEYKLMNDITVDKILIFDNGVDIDLNGHTLTFTSSYWSEYSNVSETNVKIHNGKIVIDNGIAYIWNASKNTVNLDFTDTIIDATNASAAFRTQPCCEEHWLNITGGEFTTSGKLLSADPTYSASAETPSKSNITVKGAKVTTTNSSAVSLYAAYGNDVIVANFEDCSFDCSSNYNCPIYISIKAEENNSVALTMTNCSLLAKKATALTDYIFKANAEGVTLTLNNCTGNNGAALAK